MKPTDLRGILQYIQRFREKTFIISARVDEAGIITDEIFANILLDVAVLRSLNIRVVLAHGAAAQVKARRHRRRACEGVGLRRQRHHGRGDAEAGVGLARTG